jgi:hypothetical protein
MTVLALAARQHGRSESGRSNKLKLELQREALAKEEALTEIAIAHVWLR